MSDTLKNSFKSKLWKPIELTASGRPKFNKNEVEIVIQDNIGLYQNDSKLLNHQKGRVYLTDQRIIYVHSDLKNIKNIEFPNIALDLNLIESIDLYTGFLRSNPKVTIKVKLSSIADNNPDNNNNNNSSNTDNNNTAEDIKLNTDFKTLNSGDSRKISSAPPSSSSSSHENINWVCPICYFSNNISGVELRDFLNDTDNSLNPLSCKTCGVKASKELLESFLNKNDTILYQDSPSKDGFACPNCTFINHPSMINCEICGTPLVSPNLPQSIIKHRTTNNSNNSDNSISLKVEPFVSDNEDFNKRIIKLSFRQGGSQKFYDALLPTIENLIWEKNKNETGVNKGSVMITKNNVNPSSSKTLSQKYSEIDNQKNKNKILMKNNFGIHGLETVNSIKSYESSRLMNDSLQDLEQLISKAKELINLSESYQKYLFSQKNNSNSTSFKQSSSKKISETADLLSNSKTSMKILDNIITKNEFSESYSNNKNFSKLLSFKNENDQEKSKRSGLPILYITELSRQLYEFLINENLIDKNNGLITLFELYFLYNRARGFSLISPLEMIDAVEHFEILNLNLKLLEIPFSKESFTSFGNSKKQSNNNNNLNIFNSSKLYIVSKRNINKSSLSNKIVNLFKSFQTDISLKNKFHGLSILQLQNFPGFEMNYIILSTLLMDLCLEGKICLDKQLQGTTFYCNEILSFDWNKYENEDSNMEEPDVIPDDIQDSIQVEQKFKEELDNAISGKLKAESNINDEPVVNFELNTTDTKDKQSAEEPVKTNFNNNSIQLTSTMMELSDLRFD